MFSVKLSKLKIITDGNGLFHALVVFCALLPFQFALNPAPGFDLAMIRVLIPAFFLILIFSLFKNKRCPTVNKDYWLLIVFLFLATLSLFFSHNLFWSLRKLLFLFSIFPIYFIASSLLNNQSRQRSAIMALVSGATALAIVAILQFLAQFVFGINPVYNFLAHSFAPFFLGNSFAQSVLAYPSWLVNVGGITYMRATAIFPDPHMLSYYFGMLLPWSIILWTTSKKYSHWFLISSVLLFVADICTFTRGGYLALIAGALVILPLVSKSELKKILGAIVVTAFLFIITPSSPVTGRLTSSFDVKEGSNQGRLSNWQQALFIITQNPFGVGIGMYSLAVNPDADYREPIYAHNLYLDIAAELGTPALIIFITLLTFSLTLFWKAAKINPFFIAGVASLTIFSIHSMVETPLYSVHILTIFLIILALSFSVQNNEKTV
ncbi:MAG: O-antigen ligase family protein [Candidatus Moranbacteria bacterium]|nr:O-antigen ligase family protein [Candidatus Moranbacteria bacterium]